MRYVFPVVHYYDYSTTMSEGIKALDAGADGVFLISHGRGDEHLFEPARKLQALYPAKTIGLNLLGSSAEDALAAAVNAGISCVWTDSPGVTSLDVTNEALAIATFLKANPHVQFFGSVAFKYQRYEGDPPTAALNAFKLGMLPTTSGEGTGYAPDVSKIKKMYQALGSDGSLAIASGMTPENIQHYLPYATHFLVSTGISYDGYHFEDSKLKQFIELCKDYQKELA